MRNLKRLLRLRGRKSVWLAQQLDVSAITVSRWIAGSRTPTRATLRRIANLLQCEIEEITGESQLLTEEERRILEAFRSLPDDQKPALWAVIDVLKNVRKKDDPAKLTAPVKKSLDTNYRNG